MPTATAAATPLTLFEPVEDGFIIGFSPDGGPVGQVLRAIRALDPWQRCRLSRELAWWVSDDAITRLAKRLPDVAGALDQWRRYAASPSAAKFTFTSNAAGPSAAKFAFGSRLGAQNWRYVPADITAAYVRLGLAPGAARDEVVARRRALTRTHHPDVGGDHAAMVAINAATDTVLAWLDRTTPAPAAV